MINADDVFNPADFESIRLNVYFSNTTTRTDVRDPEKCSLLELGDKWFVLELPEKCCNVKHNVVVNISRVIGKSDDGKLKESEVASVTGKVLHIMELGEGTVRATIECLQFEEKSWNNLLTMFSSRQAEIEKFFAAVKG